MKPQLKLLRESAHRWWEWAEGIRAASELESARDFIDDYFPLLDTSEVVEYLRPTSKLRDQYPTRLDLSLDLVFAPRKNLFMSGPHARELRGVALGWLEHLDHALIELKAFRERLRSPELDVFNADLNRIEEHGVRNSGEELVKVLREHYRWVFAEPRFRPPNLFSRLLLYLTVPSGKQLGLPDEWQYVPDMEAVKIWRQRLAATGLGKKEPGPNLVDAYALDQLYQVALAATEGAKSKTLPLLLTHSGKIFEALRRERDTNPEFFRIRGISLVQPPEMVLVLRLRKDAKTQREREEITEELARQMARGEAIDALLRDAKVLSPASFESLKNELDEFEKNWNQWDALRQVQQSVQKHEDSPGMLDSLERILKETSAEDAKHLQILLKQELDEIITRVDELQGKISNHIAPPGAPAEKQLELKPKEAKDVATVLVRFRSMPKVRSAAYPIGSFHFRDPEVIEELTEIQSALQDKLGPADRSEGNRSLHELWLKLHERHDRLDQPEFFLLLAVMYIAQEKWIQAYDMASQGLLMLDAPQQPAAAELYLARAGAGRAFVHSDRMDFPTTCMIFLQSAVDDCLRSLEVQEQAGNHGPDIRCLRELAVIYCSAHDPVYGPKTAKTSLKLKVDIPRIEHWGSFGSTDDPLRLAGALARRAYEDGANDEYAGALYHNTHLYVMTELDRRALDANEVRPGKPPQYEKQRTDLAGSLERDHKGDPNMLDTLMWHHRVLAEAQKRRGASWDVAANASEDYAKQLQDKQGSYAIQYYEQLVDWHLQRVRRPIP